MDLSSENRRPALAGSADRMVDERIAGKILVVDDDDMVRGLATQMLGALGYEVACAVNGQEGVEYYGAHKDEVDLVLLDMKMSVMDGRECFRQLRKIDCGVKVILSTGSAHEGAVQEVLDEGALALLQKPYAMTQLAEALEKALRKRPTA